MYTRQHILDLPTDTLVELLTTHGTIYALIKSLNNGKSTENLRKALVYRISRDQITWNKLTSKNSYRYSESELRTAIEQADCWSDIYRTLGISITSHNKRGIVRMATHYNIHLPVFTDQQHARVKQRNSRGWDKNNIFCVDSLYPRTGLRKAVIRYNILPEYRCSCCELLPVWNGVELLLELDHINGICNDNQPQNLRWLCPNCHSQTPTYKGRNVKLVDPNT